MCWLNYMAPTTTVANEESAAGDLLVPPASGRRLAVVERPSSIGRVETVTVVAVRETVEVSG